jgi:hypothetical protein
MRKSTIFISGVMTTFALVMLYNVASAYRNNQNAPEVAATAVQPTATQIQPQWEKLQIKKKLLRAFCLPAVLFIL